MSHYHTEIVMPPCEDKDIEAAVTEIMEPFDENREDEDRDRSFWDFWVIGGRWAGTKLLAGFDPEGLKKLNAEFEKHKITVSAIQFGKQGISPGSQIPLVDRLWHEAFPDAPDGPCPLFAHSNDQYSSDSLLGGDIQRFADVPRKLQLSRLIVTGPNHDGTKMKAVHMLTEDIWNGVNHERTVWDCTFGHGMELFKESLESCAEEYRQKHEPQDDWLVVTVDYHG